MFSLAICPTSHPTVSVEAIEERQNTNPIPLAWLILSSYTIIHFSSNLFTARNLYYKIALLRVVGSLPRRSHGIGRSRWTAAAVDKAATRRRSEEDEEWRLPAQPSHGRTSSHHAQWRELWEGLKQSRREVAWWLMCWCAVKKVTLKTTALGPSMASPAMGHWGTCRPRTYTNLFFFQCTLTYTKYDSNYMLTVASCKHPVTFVPLLTVNPGDATGYHLSPTLPNNSHITATPVKIVKEEKTSEAAMCSRAWRAQWSRFDSARARPSTKELFPIIHMHMMNRKLIPDK